MSFEREKAAREVWTAAMVSALAGSATRDKGIGDTLANEAERIADAALAKWQGKHFPPMERSKIERVVKAIEAVVDKSVARDHAGERVFLVSRELMLLLAKATEELAG